MQSAYSVDWRNVANEQQKGIKGAVEGLKGKFKETAGTFMGNDNMEREGRSQSHKGEAQQQAADKEAEARQAEQRAETHEGEERNQQK